MVQAERSRYRILVAEDDRDDQFLLKKAVSASGVISWVDVVENGEELLNYLRECGPTEEDKKGSFPSLILLDLNMPRKDGREALREIKGTPGLRCIPIVAFTTSNHKEDVDFCYRSGANAYITKPSSFVELAEVIRILISFWFEIARVPFIAAPVLV